MSLKLEVNQAATIAALERKIELMNTKYQQEISKLENRIKDLEWEIKEISEKLNFKQDIEC